MAKQEERQVFTITNLAELNTFLNSNTYKQVSKHLKTYNIKNQTLDTLLLKEINNMFAAMLTLNQKYPQFPLFNLKVTSFSNDISETIVHIDFCFDDFCLYFKHLAYKPSIDFNLYVYYYKPHKKTITINELDNITLLRLYYSAIFADYYASNTVTGFLVTDYNTSKGEEYLSSFYTNAGKKDTWLKENYLDRILDEDLFNLILLVINPFENHKLLAQNPLFISSFKYNLLNHKHNLNRNSDIQHLFPNWAYTANYLTNNIEGTKYTKTLRYNSISISADEFFAYFDRNYLHHLLFFSNLNYYKENTEIISSLNVLNLFKTNDLNVYELRNYQQELDFKNGLKHGASLTYFVSQDDIDNYLAYLLRASFAKSTQNRFFNTLEIEHNISPDHYLLYHTISYKESQDSSNIYLVTLNLKQQLDFLKTLLKNLTLAQSTTFNQPLAYDNINLLNNLLLKNLTNLHTFYPQNTIYTNNVLTFKQDSTSINFDRSQMFLSMHSKLNPTFNMYTVHNIELVYDTFHNFINTPKYNDLKLINQVNSNVVLNVRSTLIEVFYAFLDYLKKEAPTADFDFILNKALNAYFIFLAYIRIFFRHYMFKTKNYGFIVQNMDLSNLLYGEVYIPNTISTPINSNDLLVAEHFYNEILTSMYDQFLNEKFIEAFFTLFDDKQYQDDAITPIISKITSVDFAYKYYNLRNKKFTIPTTIHEKEKLFKKLTWSFKYQEDDWEDHVLIYKQLNDYINMASKLSIDYVIDFPFIILLKITLNKIKNIIIVPYNEYITSMENEENNTPDKTKANSFYKTNQKGRL